MTLLYFKRIELSVELIFIVLFISGKEILLIIISFGKFPLYSSLRIRIYPILLTLI